MNPQKGIKSVKPSLYILLYSRSREEIESWKSRGAAVLGVLGSVRLLRPHTLWPARLLCKSHWVVASKWKNLCIFLLNFAVNLKLLYFFFKYTQKKKKNSGDYILPRSF